MALAIVIDSDWPIAIVIGIVIDIVDMWLSTCRLFIYYNSHVLFYDKSVGLNE